MSNIYIQEPPTSGKVVLTTTLGDFEIELWSKECPKACRNFVQLCMEGFYNGTIFHRVVPNFIAQGGDPTGSGHGGESIYGEPYKNEVHSRLRFVRRGLVATANTGNDDNESQFFFTLGPTQELQNKHTIFGKVGGDTLYNLVKFNDLDIDREERPRFPPKLIKAEVINNPFPDIIPRVDSVKEKPKEEEKKQKRKGTKNLKLLSFGEEEIEEEESTPVRQFKSKSSHDLANDPTLSAVPAVESEEKASADEAKRKEQLERIQSKLQAKGEETGKGKHSKAGASEGAASTAAEDEEYENSDDERKKKAQKNLESIKEEIRNLKREMRGDREDPDKRETKKAKTDEVRSEDEDNEVLKNFHLQKEKYSEMKSKRFGEGSEREAATLALLQKFQAKLSVAREGTSSENEEKTKATDDAKTDETWLGHTLKFEDEAPVLAKDANTKGDDWFEIYDPRNPLNKRRREESKKIMKEKGGKIKNDV